jgi:hypothetical protein
MSSLLAYGEQDVAGLIPTLTPKQMDAIASATDRHSGTGYLAQAAALAAVEVLEGRPRPLARKRRAIADGEAARSVAFDPWPEDFWGRRFEEIENARGAG